MTINVVKDPSGKIIASYEGVAGNGGKVEPVLPAGHKVEAMNVADDYRSNLSELYGTRKS